jgi:hypothetical protein
MLPKDLQEKVLDDCAVNWDATPEREALRLFMFTRVKCSIKNIAKSRREMQGPKPMDIDQVLSGLSGTMSCRQIGPRRATPARRMQRATDTLTTSGRAARAVEHRFT